MMLVMKSFVDNQVIAAINVPLRYNWTWYTNLSGESEQDFARENIVSSSGKDIGTLPEKLV